VIAAAVLGAWVGVYATTWGAGTVLAVDSNTVALSAAVLSFTGAIIVALIDARSRRLDPDAREQMLLALARAEEARAEAQAELVEERRGHDQGGDGASAPTEEVITDEAAAKRRRRRPRHP
jgi:hypothetical protein